MTTTPDASTAIMSEELEEVRVLRVQPGDTIVVTVDSALNMQEFHAFTERVTERFKERFPDNEVLVLGGAPIDLTVVRPEPNQA